MSTPSVSRTSTTPVSPTFAANESGFVFNDKMMVVMNRDVKHVRANAMTVHPPQWMAVFVKLVPVDYMPSTNFKLNRTLLFRSGAVWSSEVFLTLAVIRPIVSKNLAEEIKCIEDFFIASARKATGDNVALANALGYKLALHVHKLFPDIPQHFIREYNEGISLFGEATHLMEYRYNVKFSPSWEFQVNTSSQSVQQPVQPQWQPQVQPQWQPQVQPQWQPQVQPQPQPQPQSQVSQWDWQPPAQQPAQPQVQPQWQPQVQQPQVQQPQVQQPVQPQSQVSQWDWQPPAQQAFQPQQTQPQQPPVQQPVQPSVAPTNVANNWDWLLPPPAQGVQGVQARQTVKPIKTSKWLTQPEFTFGNQPQW